MLVGLDWAKPMMFLLLHVTCSCIFHAYVPFFFILLILNVLVLFYLFLSLSLFLSVSCSMAPKQKSTPSWNPLRFGASSSSPSANSTPSHIRFVMIKPVRTFRELFTTRHSFRTPSHSIGFF